LETKFMVFHKKQLPYVMAEIPQLALSILWT
jgi:hypothetical protein